MTRDLHPRWWRLAAALVLLFALALLLAPQVQHSHASLLFVALAPVLLFSSVLLCCGSRPDAFLAEQIFPLDTLLPLPSLSHLSASQHTRLIRRSRSASGSTQSCVPPRRCL